MYVVSFIYSNLSPHYLPFSSFQGKFFSFSKDNGLFSPLPPSMIVFPNRTYQFPHCPRMWQLVRIVLNIWNSISSLCIFTIWRVAGWQQSMRRPPWMRMQNRLPFIINRSYPGGRLARVSVTQIRTYHSKNPTKVSYLIQ